MRAISLALIFSALAAGPVAAQAPPLGKLEIKAFQPIPKTKTAVQLNVDTALGRHLRGEVMGRLARRGNEVGFSGGNIMRMDVAYLDLGGGSDSGSATIGGQPSYVPPGSNPRPELPSNRVLRRDLIDIPKSKSTLRITLQLYNATTGKVIWGATASCATDGTAAVERVGDSMVEAIFRDADHSHVGDAGCPL